MSQGAAGKAGKRTVQPRLQVEEGMGEGAQLTVWGPQLSVATEGVRAVGLIGPPESTGPQHSRVPEASEKN